MCNGENVCVDSKYFDVTSIDVLCMSKTNGIKKTLGERQRGKQREEEIEIVEYGRQCHFHRGMQQIWISQK